MTNYVSNDFFFSATKIKKSLVRVNLFYVNKSILCKQALHFLSYANMFRS